MESNVIRLPAADACSLLAQARPFEPDPPSSQGTCNRCGYRGAVYPGRYGGQPLSPPDVRMVLIGKCLEIYSRHYGAVIDWDGKPFPLRSALQEPLNSALMFAGLKS